jgi:hypothetical protein
MKKLVLCTFTLIFLFCGTNALANPFTFNDITEDVGIDISGQISLVVVDNHDDTVSFIVTNNDNLYGSFITGVYFDGIADLGLLLSAPESDSSPGVNLVEDGYDYLEDPQKANVPQGTEINFDAEKSYLAVKGDGLKKKEAGIDGGGESAEFRFDIAGVAFQNILDALDSGALNIAIKIQGIGENDDSDSYATHTHVPVPEPATMLLLGAGLIGIAGLGRKKLFKKK